MNRNLNRLIQKKLDKLASQNDAFVQGNKQGAGLSDSANSRAQAQPNLDDDEDKGDLAGALGTNKENSLIPEKDTRGPVSIVNGLVDSNTENLKDEIKKKLETNE